MKKLTSYEEYMDTVNSLKNCRSVDFVNGKTIIDNLIDSTVFNIKQKISKLINNLVNLINNLKTSKRKKINYKHFIRPVIQTYVDLVDFKDDYTNIVGSDPKLIGKREIVLDAINIYIKRARKQLISIFTKDIRECYNESLIY